MVGPFQKRLPLLRDIGVTVIDGRNRGAVFWRMAENEPDDETGDAVKIRRRQPTIKGGNRGAVGARFAANPCRGVQTTTFINSETYASFVMC